MKKIILGLGLMFMAVFANAQNGLENITVEKYYVSNAADAAGSVGVLPVGSVTYRIFADMLPGYKFQAAYGVPTHTLTMSTTTSFFNNEDRGATTPTYTKTQARANSVMLDSWLSVGAACVSNFGILKSEDNIAAGGATVVNSNTPPILQNADPSAGIPLTTQDGLYAGSPEDVTFVGLSAADLSVFNATSQAGNLFSTSNGSWASLNGSSGPVAATNRVLIAQITTDGIFHYELNIQIGTPTGGVQNFVASNPVSGEISIPSLIGTLGAPNILPTVSITSPVNGAGFFTGDVVPINATANDSDGTITAVQFYVNGTLVGTDSVAPYSVNWTSTVGTKNLTAVATDNNGGQRTSSIVTINVANNIPPTVSVTSPIVGAVYTAPAVVNLTANASDADGTVHSVEFFVNGVSVGIDTTSPFGVNWTSVIGSANITARATDDRGAQTTSAGVAINILDPNGPPYTVTTTSSSCFSSIFCVPVTAMDSVKNVIGYDLVMHYNPLKVAPTGVVNVNNALINPSYVDVVNSIDGTNGLINISLYFNASAPPNTNFNGIGNVFCVEFAKTANFSSVDTAAFTVSFFQESYFAGVSSKVVGSGQYITYRDNAFNASLRFWSDNSPIKYDSSNPSQYLVTNIYGDNGSCNNRSVASVQPDLNGNFNYDYSNGQDVTIEKDIPGTTDMLPVINGFDALLTRKVLINDNGFIPSVFQMIAMDVNMDGVISAGDLSQIDQRAVLMIPEFRQAWNYDSQGNSNGQASKDWLFVDMTRLNSNPAYRISTTYPSDNGIGYSKSRVPVVPFCLPVPNSNVTDCPLLGTETYKGVLLGDINGNYATTVPNGMFRTGSSDRIFVDLSHATIKGGYADVPVSVLSNNDVNSLDLSTKFNEANLTFNSIVDHAAYMQQLSNFNSSDRTLRFTSSSLQNYEIGQPIMSIRFAVNGDHVDASDLNSLEGYINGERTAVEVIDTHSSSNTDNLVYVYPNPARDVINVLVSQNATIQLMGLDGKEVILKTNTIANEKQEINTSTISNGVYMMRIYNDNFVATKKIVIQN